MTALKATKKQMQARFHCFFILAHPCPAPLKGRNEMIPGGLLRAWGWAHDASLTYARLDRDGNELSWRHGLGANHHDGPEDAYWVRIRVRDGGNPRNPADWVPTGEAWPVGCDLIELARSR